MAAPTEWVRRFRRAGYTVESGGSHWKVYRADRTGGVLATIPASPSDWRWDRNLRAHVQRSGMDLTPKRDRGKNRKRSTSLRLTEAQVPSHGKGDDAMAKYEAADMGRTTKVRAQFREVVDEMNSLLPKHRGAHTIIVKHLIAYASEHGMQAWPNVNAGQAMLHALYKQQQQSFSVWAIDLIEQGLDSVEMPDPATLKPGPKPRDPKVKIKLPVGESSETALDAAEARMAPEHAAAAPPQNGAGDVLEVFYRLARGGMALDAAYTAARAYRAGLRV